MQLTAALGRPADRAAVRRALAEAERAATDDGARLVQAAQALGVRLVPFSGATPAVVERVAAGAPAVGHVAGGAPGWWLLLDRSGGRVQVAATPEPHWLSAGALPAATWYFAQLLAPIDPPHAHPAHHTHHHGPSPLKRLLAMLRPEARDIWLVILFALGVGILSLATPVTVDALISSVQGGTPMRAQVLVLALILLFCLGLAGGLRAIKQYVVEVIQQRFFVRVVADLSYRLPRVAVQVFDKHNGPDLVNRFFEVLTVQKAGAVLLLDGVSVVIQAAVGLVLLGFYHPFLLGYDLALLAAVAFIVFVLGRGGVASSIEESYAKYGVAGWLEEMVRHPRTFKHGSGQEYAFERADSLTRDYLLARQKHFRILYRQILFALGLQAVASAVLLGLGGWLVIPDESGQSALSVGQLVASELIVVVIVGSFVKLGKSLEGYYDLMAAADKLGHLLDLALEREGGEVHRRTGPAGLRLRGVNYAYEEHGHRHTVFRDFSASIAPGGRVAVIGPSGAGKSTLAELLYGLREPQSGAVELDGVDVRQIRLSSLRGQVALVAALEIFDGTVADNVRMGHHEVTLADVRDVLDRVGLLDEVQRLPEGLDTRLTGMSDPLSLGQARRLLLARALLMQPRLLILDESVDDFDERTRNRVLDTVLDPAAPWTALVITHRADVAARCQQRLELHPAHTEETP